MIASNKIVKILILKIHKVKTKLKLRVNNRTKIKVDLVKIQALDRVAHRR